MAEEEGCPEIRLSAFGQVAYNFGLAQRNDAMNAIVRSLGWLGCTVLLAGCISPQYTRLPTLRPSPADAGRDAYVYHNPLADREAGPAFDLPRGFERQRAEPRRTIERDSITSQIIGTSGGGSSNNPSASKYPSSVDP
jgi:hypothetical protein